MTAIAPTNGIDIIKSIEHTDKPFYLGLQYHPEEAVAKHAEGAAEAFRFMPNDASSSTSEYWWNRERKTDKER